MATIGTITWQKAPGGSSGSAIVANLDKIIFTFTNMQVRANRTGSVFQSLTQTTGGSTTGGRVLVEIRGSNQLVWNAGNTDVVVTNSSFVANGASYWDVTFSATYQIRTTLQAGANNFYFLLSDPVSNQWQTVTINAVDYNPPAIMDAWAVRCDSAGNESNLGQYIKVKAVWVYNDLGGTNAASSSFVWGPAGGAMSSPVVLTNNTWSAVQGGSVDPQSNYVATVTVTDTMGGAATRVLQIAAMKVVLEVLADGSGVAMGRAATKSNFLESNWPVMFNNGYSIGGEAFTPPGGSGPTESLVVRSPAGNAIAVFVDTGALFLKGTVYENYNL